MRPILILTLCCFTIAGCGGQEEPVDPWQTIELGTDAEFRDIFFLDADNGWMVGAVGITVPGGIVARTHDGGLTWTYQTGVIPTRSRTHSVDINAVYFLDEMRGLGTAEAGTIIRTEDGGEKWQRVKPTGPIYAQNRDIDFVSPAMGWIVGRQGVIKTEDAGETWEIVSEDLDAEGWSLDMIDAQRGWMVGKFGLVMRTDDGGITWEKVEALGNLEGLSGDEKPFLRSVHFVDEDHGWAAGSWREDKDITPTDFELSNWAVIIHTRDGGRTWKKQIEDVESYLMDIRFADTQRGWATGYNRTDGTAQILATEDGGSSWEVVKTVQGEELRAIAIKDGHVWVVGDRVRELPQRLFRLVFGETETGVE